MDHHGTDGTGRRSLLNGFVTAATRSWRHGLQPNGGHTSNAMVFPTITTTVNTSPTSRTPITDGVNMSEEQHMRLQQQWNQDHRRNVLWYGGDDINQQQQQAPALLFESQNQYQSTDDWEKQPLRQRQRKSQLMRRQQKRNRKHVLPTVPFLWAVFLLTMYAAAMSTVYFIYEANTGSGWIWLRGIASNNDTLLWWLRQISPTWYYVSLAVSASIIGFSWHKWQQQRWCCYLLLFLFSTALLPSEPLAEVFGVSDETLIKDMLLKNSTFGRQLINYPGHINDSQLALYEGLWQVAFFVFVAYCLVLSVNVDEHLDNKNEENINNYQSDGTKVVENVSKEDHHVSMAVLLFGIIASFGHILLNICTAYRWCFWQNQHRKDNSNPYMAIIQQFIANIIILTCINLSGWLLRQSVVQDRAEIRCDEGDRNFDGKRQRLRFALQRQAYKLNRLLTSLLPKRVFLEMKYNIVADAAHSYNLICGFNKNDKLNESNSVHQQDLPLQIPQLPKMYLKEYENVSVVFANVTGFWDATSSAASHSETSPNQSLNMITLVDRLLADLFRRVARRNNCLPIHLLGHRVYFVAGLPPEESYEYDDEVRKSTKCIVDKDQHAKNAIQMGLDLIDAIKTVVHDVSLLCHGRKINLNVQVGIHSGRIACGVLGFSGGTSIPSIPGSRWQYGAWGNDVHLASFIESSGRPGLVHVSRTTIEQIVKHPHQVVNFRSNIFNCDPDFNDNKNNYTFKRSHEEQSNQYLRHNRIYTYFVVPKTVCPSVETEIYGDSIKNQKNHVDTHNEHINDNYYIEGIELLISQSVEILLQRDETRRQQMVDSMPENEVALEQILPSPTTTAVVDFPTTAAALVPAAPTSAVKIIMNRHRRSKYFEQDPLQAMATKLNTSSVIKSAMDFHSRWEVDVFGGYDNDNNNKICDKSNDHDLFRLAKSHLLLLFVIISLFVVNVTTMPWTILLGITFITPFVITAGQLIYVMALLISWIPRPKFHSIIYAVATIDDDDEYYHHYDSDNNDSDSSCSSNNGCKLLPWLFSCHRLNSCSLINQIFKPFRRRTNSMITTRGQQLDGGNSQWWCIANWCRCCCCYKHHSWFSCCSDNDEASSCMSSDDSDIESRLGYRNENAVMAAGVPPGQHQLQNRLQKSQPINRSHNTNRRLRQRRQLARKYQDEKRHTWFFWLSAAGEVFVVLLICLLALLNSFTCQPTASINYIHDQANNVGRGGFNTPMMNSTLQEHHSPLTCLWPQYAVLTCCLVYVSIAVSFPIYYGSLPTLRIKIGILFVMTFVFAIAYVHFTHRDVFIAASVSSLTSSYCSQHENIFDHQAINMTNSQSHYEKNQQLLIQNYQNREQQCAADLNTATATVYAIAFAAATFISFSYKYHLQNRQAYNRVKIDRDMRRLGVLCTAHRRTLRSILPDHVATSLRKSCGGDINEVDTECKETRQRQNYVTTNTQPIPLTIIDPSQNQIPAFMLPPLYHCSYQSIVIIFASIIQQDQPSTINLDSSQYSSHRSIGQITLLHNIICEFDQLLDIHKFQGIVEKIKMVGTNTYMAAVGLQHQHKTERQMMIDLKDMEQRYNESYLHYNENSGKYVSSNTERVDLINNVQNGYQLCDVMAAHYVTFALDFVRDMRRVVHRQQTATLTPVGNSCNSNGTQFTLRVGINIGPVVAGLIGCNDEVWKRPQFDLWGNSVNIARQMDITGVPGRTQVSNCVHETLKSLTNPKYEFDIRTKMTNEDNKKTLTYFVREHFERDEGLLSDWHQQSAPPQKYHPHHYDINQIQLQSRHLPTAVPPSQNIQRMTIQQLECDQSLGVVPIVNVHAQHSYYRVHQEQRQKCSELPKTPPPPPPPRSPPPVNTRHTQHSHYQMMKQQYSGGRDRQSDEQQRLLGVQLSRDYNQPSNQQKKDIKGSIVTYARPLQKHQKSSQHSSQSRSAPVPRGLVRIFGNDSQQQVPPINTISTTSATANAKSTCTSNPTSGGVNTDPRSHYQQQSQARRPTVLPLVNTTMSVVSTKNFDADRPLPAPPRSSDTAAGRQRHHHDPRKRRRQQLDEPPTLPINQQQEKQLSGVNDDQCPAAWPSSLSFRSPISAGSLVSVSSLSSSGGSTDAGGTTTSHNNYNTTTATSSSDESFGRVATEDGGGIDQADTEGFDTAASSVAVSPINHRYRQQNQQHLLLRQWSPSTTANSSPVRRSSSFRSPLSGGDITAASSSSLKSPLIPGLTTNTCGGTQSLNRRRMRSTNTTTVGGSSSSRRRRRRQQHQNNTEITGGQSTTPAVIASDVPGVIPNSMVTAENCGSPPSVPWKKHQQQLRRPVTNKDHGTCSATAGPDFTDEIRRILLLDHHRGNIRQQQQFGDKKMQTTSNEVNNCEKDIDNNGVSQSLSFDKKQHKTVIVKMAGQKQEEKNKNCKQNESNNNDKAESIPKEISKAVVAAVDDSSTSSFEARERQITEQVKRQQAEVRRILQEHKNNVVAVVRGVVTNSSESVSHNHRQRVPTTAVEWSDDESIEPSSLPGDSHMQKCMRFPETIDNYEANDSKVITDNDFTTGIEGDEYTTDGDGDGYTTTGGYTTDDAAITSGLTTSVELPLTSTARHLDDNLSTMNDTGLTDAEAALSDVNSMIDYNDCNDNNRYRGRRQSSLSSNSVCPYASDSFCEDDDDFNDDDEYLFWDEYRVEDEKLDFGNDDDDGRYNIRLFQPQLVQSEPTSQTPSDNNVKKLNEQQQQNLQTPASPHDSSNNTVVNITQHIPDNTAANPSSIVTTTENIAPTNNNPSEHLSINSTSDVNDAVSSTE